MGEIVPTILTADLAEYAKKLKALEAVCGRVQVDIIDGKFASNQTIFLDSLKNEPTNLRIDLHLMVKEPEEWVNRALEILPDRLIGQVEMMIDPLRFVNQTIEGGMEAGLAFDLETPLTAVSEEVLHLADMILLLSVKAGFSGQEFDPRVLDKITALKKIVDDLVKIGIDGGLDEKSLDLCHKAGVEVFYVGHSFWQATDLAKRYQELTSIIA